MSIQLTNCLWLGYNAESQKVSINRTLTSEKIELDRDELVDLAANLSTFIKAIFSNTKMDLSCENHLLKPASTFDRPSECENDPSIIVSTCNQPSEFENHPSTLASTSNQQSECELFPEINLDDWIVVPSASNELKISLKREREEPAEFDIDWPENPAPLPDFGSFRRDQEKIDHEIYNGYYSDISERVDSSVESNDESEDDGGIQLWAGEHYMPPDPMGWLRMAREEDEIGRFVIKIEWLGEKVFVDIELHLINGEVVKEMAYGRNRKKTERNVAEAMIKTIAQRRKYKLPIL